MSDCIFCRIAAHQLPASLVYEDDGVVAFRDINPQAPTHILIIPKKHIARLSDVSEADLPLVAGCTAVANRLAAQEGLTRNGYRVVVNCGAGAGQSVWHLHFHLLGGRSMGWPPG